MSDYDPEREKLIDQVFQLLMGWLLLMLIISVTIILTL